MTLSLRSPVLLASLLTLFTACTSTKDDTAASAETGDTAGDTDTGSGNGGDTNAYGAPLDSTDAINGKSYAFLFANANVSEPASLGAIITAYMTAPIMIGVESVSDSSLDLVGALGVEGSDPATQDTAVSTYDFASTSFDPSSPSFSAGPTDATLYVTGVPVPVYGLSITGTFAHDGSAIGDMTFSGLVDTAPIGPLLNGGGGETAVCDAAVNFGIKCVPCPDERELCLTLTADTITAAQVSGTITPVN